MEGKSNPLLNLLVGLGVLLLVANIIFSKEWKALKSFSTTKGAGSSPRYIDSYVKLTPQGEKIKAKHFDWPNEICNIVAQKHIRIGMTPEQVKAAWGIPYKIEVTTTDSGREESWTMRELGADYLYFESGKLKLIKQNE